MTNITYNEKNYYQREQEAMQNRLDLVTNICREQEKKIKELQKVIARTELAANYYLRMQKHIQENENIRDAWTDFICVYSLAMPDQSELGDL